MDLSRISFLLPALAGYGCERSTLRIAKGLIAHGIEVELVLIGSVKENAPEIPAGVKVVTLGIENQETQFIFQKLFAIANYLKSSRPQTLITIYDSINLASLARFISGVNCQIIISVRVNLSQDFQKKGIKGKLETNLLRFTYPWSDKIIAVSQGVADDVIKLTGISSSKIKAIYNPIIPEEIATKLEEPINHPWLINKNLPVILGIGRLEYEKDFVTLIKAFVIVNQSLKSRLIILGEGSQRKELEQLIDELGVKNQVSLTGFVPNPFIYIKKSDIFVLSSRWEGLSNVILESLAVGIPIVSTDCPSGSAELLEYGKYGKLVPIGNEYELAQAILTTLKEPLDRNLLQKRAADFYIDKIVNQYLEFIKQ